MSEYPDKPLPAVTEIEPEGPFRGSLNGPCYSCGDRERPKQWEERNGYAGPHCTARFICQEEREKTAPTCVYCGNQFVPDAHRYCKEAPTIEGKNAHSTIDRRIDMKDLEKQKQKDDEIIDFLLKHNREEIEKLQKQNYDYYQQIPIVSKGLDLYNYDRVREEKAEDYRMDDNGNIWRV